MVIFVVVLNQQIELFRLLLFHLPGKCPPELLGLESLFSSRDVGKMRLLKLLETDE